jgi:hypothetical protein
MNSSFKVERTGIPDGRIVTFGPFDPDTGATLTIPATFTRRVSYPAIGLAAILECVFTGDRIEVESIKIERVEKFISTKVLTQLALPAVIREIAEDAIPNSNRWAKLNAATDNKAENPEFLAQIYWFEHVSWGSPRGSIMTYMNWSRTNANFHITKFSKNLPMPGVHSLEQQSKKH